MTLKGIVYAPCNAMHIPVPPYPPLIPSFRKPFITVTIIPKAGRDA
jgi:hypothetical protein